MVSKLKLGGLLRHISGLRSVQDLAGIEPRLHETFQHIGSVAHQPTAGDKIMASRFQI